MIASKPVRMLSLAIVALVALVGVRGILDGLGLGGGLLDRRDRTDSPAGGAQTRAVVEFVLDGDTVEVTPRGGKTARVRLLGISAPEIPHPGKPGECYGHRSARHLKELLPPSTEVALVRDPAQASVDTYGRWLRYVEVDGHDIGRALVRAGAAAARHSSDPASRYAAYQKVEARARGRGEGMWTACGRRIR